MEIQIAPVLWIAWASTMVFAACIFAYRTSIARDEEDQIFLDDAFSHERAAQSQIAARLEKLQPAVRVSVVLAVLTTLAVVGYYAWDAATMLSK